MTGKLEFVFGCVSEDIGRADGTGDLLPSTPPPPLPPPPSLSSCDSWG